MDAENSEQDREPFCCITAEQAREAEQILQRIVDESEPLIQSLLQDLIGELSGPEWDAEQVSQLVEHSSQEIEQDATDDDRRTQSSD